MNYEKFIKPLEEIIKEAGELLLTYFNNNLERFNKTDGSFATQADLASEKFLIEKLHALLPEAGFFAEESGSQDSEKEHQWVIDPLDGTTNFAQGLPYFCISVALTKNNLPVVGAIYNPLLKEFFYAIKGNGSYLNNNRLKISQKKELNASVILFAVPYKKNAQFFNNMHEVAHKAYTVRTFGAAALDQAYFAAGKADALLMQGLSWWDVAAGILIIKEAGGTVTDFEGEEITPEYKTFLASTNPIYDELMLLVKTH